MIAIGHLTKRDRNITAVDGLSFDSGARPGRRLPRSQRRVQDHHLRMLLGLTRPDDGTAAINGACTLATAAALLAACTVALLIAGR
jgi:hypothetical protein